MFDSKTFLYKQSALKLPLVIILNKNLQDTVNDFRFRFKIIFRIFHLCALK